MKPRSNPIPLTVQNSRPLSCEAVDPAQEHFNYDMIDVYCRCHLCLNYFSAIADFAYFVAMTEGHRWHCDCYLCRQKRSYHQASLASGSRRDLYCELSFLTHEHIFAPQFLAWILKIVQDTGFKTESWWANHSQKRPLKVWMTEWQRGHLTREMIAVSGMC